MSIEGVCINVSIKQGLTVLSYSVHKLTITQILLKSQMTIESAYDFNKG